MSYDPKNHFPGYEYVEFGVDGKPHNMYRGVDLGFGGYVYSEPGIYCDVALLDLQSMHPNSAVNMNYFGEYTKRFKDILEARIAIKNKQFDKVKTMFDGRLTKYLDDPTLAKQLATALKLSINSVYGLSSAKFENPFRDSRNKNNIIALRGALFMKTLQDELVNKGFTVAGIRTDSIKIPNATNDVIAFCMDFADKYGYNFQHEATYERMCLVDKANYIAAYTRPEICNKKYGYVPGDNEDHFKKYSHPWCSTGEIFKKPYVFKTLFSGEPVTFDDMCETDSVKDAVIYLDMNETLPDVQIYEKELSRRLHNDTHQTGKMKLNLNLSDMSNEDLEKEISAGHNYVFIGRVGRFYPVRAGAGGGWLMVYRNNKYDSVQGSSGFRWLEAEAVQALDKESDIDPRFHEKLISKRLGIFEQFGSYERFVDLSKPYESEPEQDDTPWTIVPCGDGKYNTCMECPECKGDVCKRGYALAVNKE